MTEVLIGRALQGVGEGIVAATCYALIPELFPSRLVAKVFGAEAVVWAVAAFGGPLGVRHADRASVVARSLPGQCSLGL